jgi:hypothetical protein
MSPRPVVGLLAALLLVTGCSTDPVPVYRDSAVNVLEATLSEGRTAELAGRLWVDHRSTHALAVVVVDESDTGVGAETDWFGQLQPPGVSGDRVRRRTLDALDATASAVQEVRISLARSDRPGVRVALEGLSSACDDLESLAEDLS